MCRRFTPDELNTMGHEARNDVICQMQDRLDKLEHDYENLIEQVRLADQQRFGRHAEKLDEMAGQLSFFNEAEGNCDESSPEPTIDETVASATKPPRKPKKKGQRVEYLKDFPQEEVEHDVPREEPTRAFGEGNWKSMPDEVFWQLRFEPARWIAEKHVVKMYVGTDGLHQDEFLRGDHPATLFRGSIATPSLEAAVINAKYVSSNPLDRIARDFQTNGLNLSKQTMSNWAVWSAERYFPPVYDLMKKRQLEAHVNQCDETPLEVIHNGRPAGSKSYMWVHLTGELSPGPGIVVYEYQKTRHSDHPKEYYKDFKGILMTDGLEQYHKLAREQEGLVRIGAIYDLEEALKGLSHEARLKERQSSIKPLVEEYFTWIKDIFRQGLVLPKSETAKGLAYNINQEEYLKVFLTDGEVPIDDSASERALKNFTIGRKNWVTINTPRGAQASAVIYSITETARANDLNVYYYIRHLLTELPQLIDENGKIKRSILEPLMPWSETLPANCYSKRRLVYQGAENLMFTHMGAYCFP